MIKRSYFTFNGIFSYEYGVLVEKQPQIIIPQRRFESLTIPGRIGSIYSDDNTYNCYTKIVECAILSQKYVGFLGTWLTGYGDVAFSNEKEHYYKAMVKNQISLQKIMRQYYRFSVEFLCQPFKYNAAFHDDLLVFTANNSVFYGKGTFYSQPVITVYGNGNINLVINGKTINLLGVTGSIVINSEIMDSYKGTENQNMKMVGDFPTLNANNESNTLTWSGSVQKIEIEPNWRWA